MRLGYDEVEGEREKEESDEPVDVDHPAVRQLPPWSLTFDGHPAPRTILQYMGAGHQSFGLLVGTKRTIGHGIASRYRTGSLIGSERSSTSPCRGALIISDDRVGGYTHSPDVVDDVPRSRRPSS